MEAGGYAFGEERGRESERLAAVQQAFDGPTRLALGEAGLRAGWRCWEVGAGLGSIARWLAEAVGPRGRVLATDLDDRWFGDAGATGNLEFRAHDLTSDPGRAEEFDLVHARFVLEHLPGPEAVIARLARALRPGGVLVLEDSAGLDFAVEPPTDALAGLAPRWERAGASVGWSAAYGRALIGDLRAAGLRDLRGFEYRRHAPGGVSWEHVVSGLERLQPELLEAGVSEAELGQATACLRDCTRQITGPPVLIAWGRARPD